MISLISEKFSVQVEKIKINARGRRLDKEWTVEKTEHQSCFDESIVAELSKNLAEKIDEEILEGIIGNQLRVRYPSKMRKV